MIETFYKKKNYSISHNDIYAKQLFISKAALLHVIFFQPLSKVFHPKISLFITVCNIHHYENIIELIHNNYESDTRPCP